ncbi:MAG: ABC transporter substrate-binding protein [Candidatus Methanomethylophilaceae archaeon]
MNKQMPVTIAIVLVLLAGAVGFGAGYVVYNNSGEEQPTGVIDAVGRSVQIPDSLDDGIVTVGVDTLRFVSYFNLNEKVVMVDAGDKSPTQNGKAYQYAYGYYTDANLTSHTHNGLPSADIEAIGNLQPSLIIVSHTVYNNFKVNCDILAKSFNLVVIYELSEESFMTENYTLDDDFIFQVELLGQIFQMEDRAQELIDGINGFFTEIRDLVDGRTSNESVYLAGTAVAGARALDWTVGNFVSLELVGGNNAYTGSTSAVALDIGPEAVGDLDFDIAFVDPTSFGMIIDNTDSQAVLEYFESSGVDIYVMMPYFWFGCNFDNVIANAYYLAYVLYDGIYNQSVMMGYINGVYEFFYGDNGTDVFTKMDARFTGVTVSLPLLTQVEVVDGKSLAVVV